MVSLCTAGLMVQVCVLVVHRSHALFSGNMEGNTTTPAADTVWINVGAAPELSDRTSNYWSSASSRSEYTWQPTSSVPVYDPNDAVEIDSSELQGVAISLETAGKTHRARMYDKDGEGSGGATSTSYYL